VFLVSSGVGQRGRTLLSLAAELGHVKVLNTLLWHHADPNIPDNVRMTFVMDCILCGYTLRGARWRLCEQDGRTPLIEAAEKGHSEVVRFLLDAHVSLNDQDIIVSVLIASLTAVCAHAASRFT
jgi:hypothetical protein